MEILIAADVVPTKSNEEDFKDLNFINNLGKEFKSLWLEADYRMFNLECPLGSHNMKPIDKCGSNLIASSDTINGIKSLRPDLIFLANNHILDYGQEGLNSTLNLLKENKISYLGIVENLKDDNTFFIIEKNGVKVGIYNLCENEFSVATKISRGANALTQVKNYKDVNKLKKQVDYVVVIYHGGKEFYRYPSPDLQEICRNFVDFGADIVVTQHSHCIGCVEKYNNKSIIYGQGNFIFDRANDEFRNTSLIVKLDIDQGEMNISYIPIEKNGRFIKISKDKTILENFKKRSEEIKREGFIEEQYSKFADKNLNLYLYAMNRKRIYNKILNRIFNRKFFTKIYNKKDCLEILNYIECEAHRELFIKGLKNKIEGDK